MAFKSKKTKKIPIRTSAPEVSCGRSPVCRKSVQHNDDEQAAKKVGNAAESFLIERVNLKVLTSESILGARYRAQIGMATPRATGVVVNLPVAQASLSRV